MPPMCRANLDKVSRFSVDPATLLAAASEFQRVKAILIQYGDDEVAIVGDGIERADKMPHLARMTTGDNSALI
jgi:hypothetical protein